MHPYQRLRKRGGQGGHAPPRISRIMYFHLILPLERSKIRDFHDFCYVWPPLDLNPYASAVYITLTWLGNANHLWSSDLGLLSCSWWSLPMRFLQQSNPWWGHRGIDHWKIVPRGTGWPGHLCSRRYTRPSITIVHCKGIIHTIIHTIIHVIWSGNPNIQQ